METVWFAYSIKTVTSIHALLFRMQFTIKRYYSANTTEVAFDFEYLTYF